MGSFPVYSTCLQPRYLLPESGHGTFFRLDQELQCHQPGVGSWKGVLSQDNGLKCPVGLLAHLPFSPGHVAATLGPAASDFQDGFLPILVLQPMLLTASVSGLTAGSLQVTALALLWFLGLG